MSLPIIIIFIIFSIVPTIIDIINIQKKKLTMIDSMISFYMQNIFNILTSGAFIIVLFQTKDIIFVPVFVIDVLLDIYRFITKLKYHFKTQEILKINNIA